MASVTRSTRRAEPGKQQEQRRRKQEAAGKDAAAAAMHSRTAVLHQAANGGGSAGERTGRTKRSIDERDFEAIKPKRSRIAVEILSKPRTVDRAVNTPTTTVATPTVNTNEPVAPAATTTAANVANTNDEPKKSTAPKENTVVSTTSPEQQQNITKNQSKVLNGMKHELDRLQPQTSDTKSQGRKLRSQEATKFKSELSAYFPDYDEVIGNEAKQHYLLNVETPIVITDTPTHHGVASHEASPYVPRQQQQNATPQTYAVRGYGDALFSSVFDVQRIDFGFLEAQLQLKNKTPVDTLPDTMFMPVHKRAERLERSIRNTEKGRAQHEKDRIIHLLEGLQGHDWLRVMGVSGVTDTKKKEYQPARQYFMKGCQGILDKFRNWTLEEKRRKLEKERALAEQASEGSKSDDASSRDNDESDEEGGEEDASEGPVEDGSSLGAVSETSSPAKQLREEALARSKLSTKTLKRPRGPARLVPPKLLGPPKEFKSFFSKKYERETAITHKRRAGRKVLAWGLPIPELPESDFMLPADYRDEDTLRLRARKKRRDKRNSRQ